MIPHKYSRAYTEVLEIIKHFPKEDYDKIPEEKIEFYKSHMDKNYNFIIKPEVDLSEQNISPEANAIMVNLFKDYFATEEQKIKINEILDLNQKKEEQGKYSAEDIFKRENNNTKITHKETSDDNTKTELIEYNKSFFTKFKNFIFKILHINK